MKSLLKRLHEVDSLPVLPETVRELQRVLVEDTGDAELLMKLLEKDVSLSTSVLACANSALYNYSGRTIINLRDAIVRVGREELYSILMTNALINVIPSENNTIDYRSFWVHSLATASLLRKLKPESSIEKINSSPLLYTAGLFHDMGMLLYAIYFEDRLQYIRMLKAENSWSFFECEQKINPAENHATIGAALLEIWKMDPTLTQLVRYHEEPLCIAQKHSSLAAILHLASQFVASLLPNYELSHGECNVVPSIYTASGLLESDFELYREFAEKAIYRAYDTLSIWSNVSLRPVGSSQLFRPV